jgi:predicted transcriptional regulator
MSREVVTIDTDEPVARAAERLAEQDVGVLAVCGADRRLSAVITDRDIVVRTLAQGLDPERLTAGECGTRDPATVTPSETLEQAARRMDEQQVRRLPVVQGGRLVGIVSQSDLAANGAHRQTGRLLARMAQVRGDRRSARWLLRRSYRESDHWKGPRRPGRGSTGGRLPAGSQPTADALAPLVDSPPSIYLAGLVLGVVLAALALLQLGPLT